MKIFFTPGISRNGAKTQRIYFYTLDHYKKRFAPLREIS
jgi:hypothetical protein